MGTHQSSKKKPEPLPESNSGTTGTQQSSKKTSEQPVEEERQGEVGLYRFPPNRRLVFAAFAIQHCCWASKASKRSRWAFRRRRDPSISLWQHSPSLALKVAAWVLEPIPRSAWLGLERPAPTDVPVPTYKVLMLGGQCGAL